MLISDFQKLRLASLLSCVATCVLLVAVPSAEAYRTTSRWISTATNPVGLQQGDPTHITWSFAPDGTPSVGNFGDSTGIAFYDSLFGEGPGGDDLTQRPWFSYFEDSFNRFGQLSGLSYSYEPNDDGVLHNAPNAGGFLGVRGDVRIFGAFIDGPSSILGFNLFPSGGSDMTLDVADFEFYSNSAQNFAALRNTIMHEHGHGLGLLHTETDPEEGPEIMMNPFAGGAFDGPQFDDLLGIHRGYGDFFEKSNNGQGNEVAAHATPLGTVTEGQSAIIGADGRSLFVPSDATDFISIDDDGDVDYLSFRVNNPAIVDVTLTPVGEDYPEAEQFGIPTTLSPSTFSDLAVQLFDTDGFTQLAVDNSGGFGEADTLTGIELPAGGEYFLRITGSEDEVQFYELEVTVVSEFIDGDFNDDGVYDCADIDGLVADIVAGTGDALFDLNSDGNVDLDDLNQWLTDAGDMLNPGGAAFLPGDANLDGFVDVGDLNIWNTNRFTANTGWCGGDFNADGFTDVGDLNLWNMFKFNTTDRVAAVPEPSSLSLLMLAGLGLLRRRDR